MFGFKNLRKIKKNFKKVQNFIEIFRPKNFLDLNTFKKFKFVDFYTKMYRLKFWIWVKTKTKPDFFWGKTSGHNKCVII